VLLLLVGGVVGAIVVARMNKGTGAPLTAAPPAASAAAPAASSLEDAIATLKKADADENAKLQQEVDDARKAALAAEHKVELMSAAQAAKRTGVASSKGDNAPPAAPAEPPHAHIIVLARGGAPLVLIDGRQTVNNAPTVVEVLPGKHVVSVRGANGNQFTPSEYNLDLVRDDTQQVVFVSQRAALFQLKRQQALDSVKRVRKPGL